MAERTCDHAQRPCTIEASVPTGFESVAAEEAQEMFETECRSVRGKITFQTPFERVKDILQLGGVDHCRAQILRIPDFDFTDDGDDCLTRLQLLVKDCNWKEGLEIWSKFYSFEHPISPQPDVIPTDEELIDVCHSVHMPGKQGCGEGKKKRNRRLKKKEKRGKENSRQGEEVDKMENYSNGRIEHQDPAVNHHLASEDTVSDGQNKDLGSDETRELAVQNQTLFEGKASESESAANDTIEHHRLKEEPDSQSPVKKFKNCDSTESFNNENAIGNSGKLLEEPAGCPANSSVLSGADVAEPVSQETTSTSQPGNQIGNGSKVLKLSKESESTACPDKEIPSKRDKLPRDASKPVFRVTCKRTGENHSFDSMSAAASMGSAVQTYFGWSVNMTKFDIEIMLTIDNSEVSVGLTLTPESLHKRNLVAFGVTTLRPTICHNMLRMVKISPGDVVCDPLCGTSSISIQGALRFPAMQLCGDNNNVAMEKTLQNTDALYAKRVGSGRGGLMMDSVQWNACHLPLRDGVVDVFVSDLPFGKRVGRKFENQMLYCNVLDEMARCGKFNGRAALLTGDINNMVKAIIGQRYWIRQRCYGCNIGGIAAGVFLLYRSLMPYTSRRQRKAPTSVPHDASDLSPSSGGQLGESTSVEGK